MNSNSRADSVLQIGEIVLILQKVERLLFLCLKVTSADATKSMQKLLSGNRATLGQLVKAMKDEVAFPNSFENELSAFIEKRNKLIHSISFEEWFDLFSEEGRKAVDIYLSGLLSNAKECLKIFSAYLITKSINNHGRFNDIDTKKFLEQIMANSPLDIESLPPDILERDFVDEVTANYVPQINKKEV